MKSFGPTPVKRESPMLTVREVSRYLRVHQTTVYRLLKAHKLPAFQVGSDWRFNREEIRRWIMNQQRSGGPMSRALCGFGAAARSWR
jgi:excisionase family DNA binding protein